MNAVNKRPAARRSRSRMQRVVSSATIVFYKNPTTDWIQWASFGTRKEAVEWREKQPNKENLRIGRMVFEIEGAANNSSAQTR